MKNRTNAWANTNNIDITRNLHNECNIYQKKLL